MFKWLMFVYLFLFMLFFPSPTMAEGTLQEMIDAANKGDELIIPPGTYEETIIITKSLKIKADNVILKSSTDAPTVSLQGNQISLSGFTIFHENGNHPAVLVEGNENKLLQLKITSNSTGVQLKNAHQNVIEFLQIERDQPVNLASTNMSNRQGNGIDLWMSHDNTVRNNLLIHQLDAIYLESSDRNIVEGNHIFRSRYGFHLMFSNETVLHKNVASFNITGAMVMDCDNVIITENEFSKQSKHVHSQGLLLYDVTNSFVSKNEISENVIGLYLEKSSLNEISDNTIESNFVALQMKQVEAHTLQHNHFLTNVIQARVTDSTENDVRNNYWDTHLGLDFTGDQQSELSFQADPIFLSIVEKKPPYQILAQSPGLLFFQLLFDMNEETVLKDKSPLVSPMLSKEQKNSQATPNDVLLYGFMLLGSLVIIYGGIRK